MEQLCTLWQMAVRRTRPKSLAGDGYGHDTSTPDVETASSAYASRFSGPVGEWFLQVQSDAVLGLLGSEPGPLASILELGGGHGQLIGPLTDAGYHVVTHGSQLECHLSSGRASEDRLVSDLWTLPFHDGEFDVVAAVRLMAHVENWQELLTEMSRVSRRLVLFDIPMQTALHHLSPALFRIKRRWESNTRPYFQYCLHELEAGLELAQLRRVAMVRQFFLPMALHRALKQRALSRYLERVALHVGLTRSFGSPAILLAERTSNHPIKPQTA